ncbi:unnamed protein product [Amoebophrya sp. A25]|nr:unnamed protein product [Amoebophrya sp. A25]|eukprot:GSA25T00019068001.1
MESIRRISRRMDALIDMIPVRYYMNSEENWRSLPGVDDSTPTTQVIQKLAQARAKTSQKSKKQVKKANNKNQKLQNGSASNASKATTSPATSSSDSTSTNAPGGPQDLRAKLQAKIEALKNERHEKQRAEDLKRKREMLEESTSSGNKKKKQVDDKQDSSSNGGESKKTKLQKEQKSSATSSKKSTEDAAVEDVDFGLIRTEKAEIDKVYNAPKKGSKWKRVEKEMRDQERHEKKLSKLGEKERQSQLETEKMDKALRRAAGERVRDDLSKLKNTKKAMEKKKQQGRRGFEGEKRKKVWNKDEDI